MHPNPDAVLAPLFTGGSGFFLASDKVQLNYDAAGASGRRSVRVGSCSGTRLFAGRVLSGGGGVRSVGDGGADRRAAWPRGPVKLRPEIVEFIGAEDGSGAQIAEQVADRFGVRLHRRTIERVRGR